MILLAAALALTACLVDRDGLDDMLAEPRAHVMRHRPPPMRQSIVLPPPPPPSPYGPSGSAPGYLRCCGDSGPSHSVVALARAQSPSVIYTEGTLWIAWSQTHDRGGEVELNDVRLVEWDVVSAGPIRETTAHGEGAVHGLSIESTLDGPVVIATTTTTSQRITFDTDLVERSLVRAWHAYDAEFELDHTWDTTGDVPVEGEGGARIVGAHLQNIDVYPQHCRAIAIGAHVVEACPHLARNGGSPPRVGKVRAIARSTPKNAMFPGK